MKQFPIGVIVESFRTDTLTAIKTAADMGVQGLQMYCTYGEHAPENMSAAQKAINKKDLSEFSDMLSSILANGSTPREKKRLLSAVTCGRVEFFKDSLSHYAQKIYLLDDPWGASSHEILSRLRADALKRGLKIISCPCSVIPERLEHIIIPSEKIAVSVKNPFHNTQKAYVEAGGFYYDFNKEDAILRQKNAQKLIENAAECVLKAKILHDELEKYYVDAMDFAPLEDIAQKIIKKKY